MSIKLSAIVQRETEAGYRAGLEARKLLTYTPPSEFFASLKDGQSVYAETLEHGWIPGIVTGKERKFYWPFDNALEVVTVRTLTHVEEFAIWRVKPMFVEEVVS